MFGLLKEVFIFLQYRLKRPLPLEDLCSEEFRLNGVQLVKRSISESSVRILRKFIDKTLDAEVANVWRDELCSDERIYGAERIFPEMRELLPVDEMRRIGESYLGRSLPHYFILAARLQYKEGNVGSGGGWHRDSPFTPQFKFITYLSDVGNLNGPFEYVLRSHSSIDKIRSKFALSKMRFTEEEVSHRRKDMLTVVGKAGSTLLVDTKGLHRGAPINSGERYACTVYFFENKRGYDKFSSLLQCVND